MARPLMRREILDAYTTARTTTNFRHTLPFPRHWLTRTSWANTRLKAAPSNQRFKFWNITVGDEVCVRSSREKRQQRPDSMALPRQVTGVNKFTNRVFLKPLASVSAETGKVARPESVHYSRCQLLIPHRYGKAPPGMQGPVLPRTPGRHMVRVRVVRMKKSSPRFSVARKCWEWERIATKVWPPEKNKEFKGEHIPWPGPPEKPEQPDPTHYDTEEAAVREITYKPPSFGFQGEYEQRYVRALFDPMLWEDFDDAYPMELHVKELYNVHSRRAKQKRWQAYQQYKKDLKDEMIEAELLEPRGRNKREATVDAIHRYKARLAEEEAIDKKYRIGKANREKKAAKVRRKYEKHAGKIERMRNVVLRAAANQVIPRQVKALPSHRHLSGGRRVRT